MCQKKEIVYFHHNPFIDAPATKIYDGKKKRKPENSR